MNTLIHRLAADDGGAAPSGTLSTVRLDGTETTGVNRVFNKRVLAELQETRDVISAARLEPYATILEEEYEITPAMITALEEKVNQAASAFGLAHTLNLQGSSSTAAENSAEEEIIAAIRRIHTGVRLTFPTSQADQERYFIGIDLDVNEERLTQIAQTILDLLKTETLRSVGATQKQRLQTALARWQTEHGTRSQSESGALTDYSLGRQLMKEVNLGRREIQIAMDGEFPFSDPLNAGHRSLFKLPEHRPFYVIVR